jgi:hypothetical protein
LKPSSRASRSMKLFCSANRPINRLRSVLARGPPEPGRSLPAYVSIPAKMASRSAGWLGNRSRYSAGVGRSPRRWRNSTSRATSSRSNAGSAAGGCPARNSSMRG